MSLARRSRAELNESEALGKVVTVRPPKHLAQLRNVSHALFSFCRSSGQKRQNWYDLAANTSETIGGDHVACTAGRMWLICSNRKLYHKQRCFCYR